MRFVADVPATRPGGLGDYQPPSAVYRTTMLAVDDTAYERHIPLAQRVRPGSTDRFELPVYANRSSKHDLRIRLIYGRDNSVLSHPIQLDLFVPRNPAPER